MNRREQFVRAILTIPEGNIEASHFFSDLKNLQLLPANLEVSMIGKAKIRIQSDTLALMVRLETKDERISSVEFSDNFFNIYPEIPKIIEFRS